MKISTFIIILLLLFSGTVSAQKRKGKKKPRVVEIVKEKPTQKINKTAPEISIKKSGAVPMVSVSPAKQKFYNERICLDCDTLVLKPGKAHIVLYDIKKRSNWEETMYSEQPAENDFQDNNIALKGILKREWEELGRNFSEKDIELHHVYRNTLVTAENLAKEDLNLLDRQEYFEGVIYWSGNKKDKISNQQKVIQSTERISKMRGQKKVSSYNLIFKSDSLKVATFMETLNPDKNIQASMNTLLQSEIIGNDVLPLEIMKLEKVKKITVWLSDKEAMMLSFNAQGQMTEFSEKGDRQKTTISYKNNLPAQIFSNEKLKSTFFYQGKNVILKGNNDLTTFQLDGKLFFHTSQYKIQEKDYTELNIKSTLQYNKSVKNELICDNLTHEGEERKYSVCYSNTEFKLPLRKESRSNDRFEVAKYFLDNEKNLVLTTEDERRSTKTVYNLQNGILKNLQFYLKEMGGNYVLKQTFAVDYEFY